MKEGRYMFYLTTHSTHFIYGYMALDIWLRTILIVKKETRCRHTGYSLRLTASVLLYAQSQRQDSTYHSLCYTSCGAPVGTRNSSMGPPHEGSIRRPITPWANALTRELHLAPYFYNLKSANLGIINTNSEMNEEHIPSFPVLTKLWSNRFYIPRACEQSWKPMARPS